MSIEPDLFYLYRSLDKRIERIKDRYFKGFPISAKILDTAMRYRLLKTQGGVNRELLDYHSVGRIRAFRREIEFVALRFYLFLARQSLRSRKLVIAWCPRAPEITRVTYNSISRSSGYVAKENQSRLYLRYLNFFVIHTLEKNGGLEALVSIQTLRKDPSEHLKRVESLLTKAIDVVTSEIERQRICVVLCHDFHTIVGRLLCLSLNLAGAKTVEVAHGYTTHPALLTLAPVTADYSVVWTNRLLNQIFAVVPSGAHGRFVSFGPPVAVSIIKPSPLRRSADKVCLIVFPPLRHLASHEQQEVMSEMARLVRRLDGLSLPLLGRLKPTDKSKDLYRTYPGLQHLEFSKESLQHDLMRAAVALGPPSTALLEAHLFGVHSIQIVPDGERPLIEAVASSCASDVRGGVDTLLRGDVDYERTPVSLRFDARRYEEFLVHLLSKNSVATHWF